MLTRRTAMKPLYARVATYQLALADTFGLSIDGQLLVLIGFWPLAPGQEEVFFAAADPHLVMPHAVPLYRAGRLIVAARMQNATIDRIVASTSSRGQDFGGRLARKVGLVPRVADPPGAFFIWELTR